MHDSVAAMPQPKPWRVVIGFLLAPLVPAALWLISGLEHPENLTLPIVGTLLLPVLLMGGYPPTILLGVPAYLLLRRRLRPRLLTFAIVGGVIAAIPWLVLMLLTVNPSQASLGACQTVVDGETTWCGYVEGLKFLSLIFGMGAVGGLTFWLSVVWNDPRLATKPAVRNE